MSKLTSYTIVVVACIAGYAAMEIAHVSGGGWLLFLAILMLLLPNDA